MSKRLRMLLLIVVFGLIAAACSDSTSDTTSPADTATTAAGSDDGTDTATTQPGAETDATEAPPDGDPVTVRAAITGGEDTLNPYTYISGFPGWNLLMLQYDSLMQFDASGEPQPWLAESVEVNADLTEYTVTLVDGVTWHDGEALTIDDVVFTFEYFVEKAAGRFARDLSSVESVATDGDRTITITLAEPNPAFDLVALADVPIIPQHIWESVDAPEEHLFDSVTNVGSGPFQLVEYSEEQSYRFQAFDGYFRGAPAVDELVVVVFWKRF